jgi:hypothetical protein
LLRMKVRSLGKKLGTWYGIFIKNFMWSDL